MPKIATKIPKKISVQSLYDLHDEWVRKQRYEDAAFLRDHVQLFLNIRWRDRVHPTARASTNYRYNIR